VLYRIVYEPIYSYILRTETRLKQLKLVRRERKYQTPIILFPFNRFPLSLDHFPVSKATLTAQLLEK